MRRFAALFHALAAGLMAGGYAVSMSLASFSGEGTRPHELPLVQPLSSWTTFAAIVGHNGLVALMIVVGGMSLGVITIAQLWSIGYLFGLQVAHAAEQGMTSERIIAMTLPHAIAEFAAFVVAGGIGLKIAAVTGRYYWHGEACDRRTVRRSIKGLGIVLALILVAGGIETYLTPWCAEMVQ
ncbi:MAG: stage II sporulation protein M [Byssovorax sp.]